MEPSSPEQSEGKHIPLLLCPYCRKNIPQLMLKPSGGGEMQLALTCSCSKDERSTSLKQFIEEISDNQSEKPQCPKHPQKAAKYCVECSIWLCKECLDCHSLEHLLIENEVTVKCKAHDKPYSFYCFKCLLNLCHECSGSHSLHALVNVNLIESSNSQVSEIEAAMERNHLRAQRLKERIDKHSPDKSQIKLTLYSAYSSNESINRDLLRLYQSLFKTAALFKAYPIYALMKLQLSICINTREPSEEKPTIEDEFNQLNDYFRMHSALKRRYTYQCKSWLRGHTWQALSLIELKNGQLASASWDHTMMLWNKTTNQLTTTLTGHGSSINYLIELVDGRLASASDDKSIKLWAATTYRCQATLTGHRASVVCLAEVRDSRLASGSLDKTIKLWSTFTFECQTTLTLKSIVNHLIELKEGRLAYCSWDNTIILWNSQPGKRLATLRGHSDPAYRLVELKDGRLASCSWDKTIKLWSTQTWRCIATFSGHQSRVNCLFQLKDGNLASGSYDKTIRIWNVNSNELETTLSDCAPVLCLIEMSDGRLASGSNDATIQLWRE